MYEIDGLVRFFPIVIFSDLGLCSARRVKGLENRTRSQFSYIGRRRNAPDVRVSAILCTRCAVKCDFIRGMGGLLCTRFTG